MINISISERFKNKCSNISLGIIEFNATVTGRNDDLWRDFNLYLENSYEYFESLNIKEVEEIKAGRNTYKLLGRDPDRYRLSSEALIRRIKTGNHMYQINSLVDLNNFISIQSYFSIGLYDKSKIGSDILFDYGNEGEVYESLAKGMFDVTNLPIFRDAISGFGSPTSDSKRSCISLSTNSILMIIISFTKGSSLSEWIKTTVNLLIKYTNATNIKTKILE